MERVQVFGCKDLIPLTTYKGQSCHRHQKNLGGPEVEILDQIGSLFVYRSPTHEEAYKNFLLKTPNRVLRMIAGTTSHYSKKKLIELILQEHS